MGEAKTFNAYLTALFEIGERENPSAHGMFTVAKDLPPCYPCSMHQMVMVS